MKELFWRVVSKCAMPFIDKPLPPATSEEIRLAEELRNAVRPEPAVETAGHPPSEAAWLDYMKQLRELLLRGDPREFLRWGPVGVMMFPVRVSYFLPEYLHLRRSPQWRRRWRPAVKESPAGHPIPFVPYPASSGMLIRHAYHVAMYEEQMGLRAEEFSFVFEFGGGYGSMCRLFHRLGFRGTYVIYDLPVFNSLQEYYLKSVGISILPHETRGIEAPGTLCISDFDQLAFLVQRGTEGTNSLFVANESFSEIPIDQRDKFLPLLARFRGFLISYSNLYREAENRTFFARWREQLGGGILWKSWPIMQMPGYTYLMGMRVDPDLSRPGK